MCRKNFVSSTCAGGVDRTHLSETPGLQSGTQSIRASPALGWSMGYDPTRPCFTGRYVYQIPSRPTFFTFLHTSTTSHPTRNFSMPVRKALGNRRYHPGGYPIHLILLEVLEIWYPRHTGTCGSCSNDDVCGWTYFSTRDAFSVCD